MDERALVAVAAPPHPAASASCADDGTNQAEAAAAATCGGSASSQTAKRVTLLTSSYSTSAQRGQIGKTNHSIMITSKNRHPSSIFGHKGEIYYRTGGIDFLDYQHHLHIQGVR